jgi:AraC-like DNA-binding protein
MIQTSNPFAPKAPLERLLFASPSVGIGTFRCAAEDPRFPDTGPSSTYCFAFPRTSVWIQHAGGSPFVADPGIVTYYNAGQEYSRRKLSPDGDRAEWFAIAPHIAEEIIAAVAPSSARRRRSDAVFGFTHGPSDPATYLVQRRICERLAAGSTIEALEIEERVIQLLATLTPRAADCSCTADADTIRRKRTLTEDARALLASTAAENMHLAEVARRLSCSVFHLCRVFKEIHGTTLHAYRVDVRLRMALERIVDSRADLTRVALDLGFCSHSHFTAAFRRQFGVTPSAYIADLR